MSPPYEPFFAPPIDGKTLFMAIDKTAEVKWMYKDNGKIITEPVEDPKIANAYCSPHSRMAMILREADGRHYLRRCGEIFGSYPVGEEGLSKIFEDIENIEKLAIPITDSKGIDTKAILFIDNGVRFVELGPKGVQDLIESTGIKVQYEILDPWHVKLSLTVNDQVIKEKTEEIDETSDIDYACQFFITDMMAAERLSYIPKGQIPVLFRDARNFGDDWYLGSVDIDGDLEIKNVRKISRQIGQSISFRNNALTFLIRGQPGNYDIGGNYDISASSEINRSIKAIQSPEKGDNIKEVISKIKFNCVYSFLSQIAKEAGDLSVIYVNEEQYDIGKKLQNVDRLCSPKSDREMNIELDGER